MKKKVKRCICSAVIAVCAGVIVWNGWSIFKTMREYRHGDDDIQKIYQLMSGYEGGSADETSGQTGAGASGAAVSGGAQDGAASAESDREARLASYRQLKENNSDMIGWVQIENTVIDYPVMQTPEEPDYYLHRGFDRQYSSYGMIYMDARCSLEKQCPNYVIYGHHMRNGSMFAALDSYKDEEFWKAHPVIRFDTLEDTGEYEVAGVIRIPAAQIDDDFLNMFGARTEENYNRFIEYMKSNGYYDTGITPVWPEQLLTLTTCEYSVQDGRLLVVARLMDSSDEAAR